MLQDNKLTTRRRPVAVLRDTLQGEARGGLVLMLAAPVALAAANSPLAPSYFGLLKTYIGGLSVLHWINDALMAVFFQLVGLENQARVRRRTSPLPSAYSHCSAPASRFR